MNISRKVRVRLGAAAVICVAAAVSVTALTGSASAAQGWASLSAPVFKDATTGATLRCNSSAVSLTPANTGNNPAGQITSITFTYCQASVGASVTLTAKGLNWPVTASPTLRQIGELTGGHGISVAVSGSGCTADIDGTGANTNTGTVSFAFHGAAATTPIVIVSGGNLHAYASSGCAGFLNNGDAITFTVTYRFT